MQTFREMLSAAGIPAVRISRLFGYQDDWARERIYSRRLFSDDQLRAIAKLSGLPFADLRRLHRAEVESGGFYARKAQENIRQWSAEEDAILRDIARSGGTPADAVKALDRSYNAIFSRATRLGLFLARSAPGTIKATEKPEGEPLLTEEQAAALYAGRRYENVRVRESQTGQMPRRPDRISASGNAAAMCVEAAR